MNIKGYIEKHRERFTSELLAFCRQPSIANTGEGMELMASMVHDRLQRLGASVERKVVPGSYPYICADIGQGPRTLLVYNHYDVQPARLEDGWTNPPFEPDIRSGYLYARGVADNKANMLFRIQAVEAYQAIYGELPIRVRFFIEGEEEIGSPHLKRFLLENSEFVQADGCIWEGGRTIKGRPTLQMGLRGILYLELSIYAASRALHSSWANIVDNPALSLIERLLQALHGITDSQKRPAFGELLETIPPPTPRDLEMLAAIPLTIEDLPREHHIQPSDGITNVAEAFRRVLFEPSCTVCGIGCPDINPGVKTTIPNYAKAKLDFRLPPGMNPDHVETSLRQHLDERGFQDVHIQRLIALQGARTSPDTAIVQATRDAIRHTYGIEPILYPFMPASGPMYDLCQAQGTPAVTFGAGHAGDNVHGVDENICIDDYFQALEAFTEIFSRFTDTE